MHACFALYNHFIYYIILKKGQMSDFLTKLRKALHMNGKNFLRYDARIQEFLACIPAQLREVGTYSLFQPGTNIAVRDDPVEYAFFLLSGEAIVLYQQKDGRLYSFLTLNPFTVISDLEMLSGKVQYAATVIATKESATLRVPVEEFRSWLNKNLWLINMVASSLARNTYTVSYIQGTMIYQPALQKVIQYLVKWCTYAPPTVEKPTIVTKTRQLIAEEIGVSEKTINRSLCTLYSQNCLCFHKGKARISQVQYQILCRRMSEGV